MMGNYDCKIFLYVYLDGKKFCFNVFVKDEGLNLEFVVYFFWLINDLVNFCLL